VTGAELLALAREILRDETLPYLFSDTTLYRYLNEAPQRMAERSFCIVDDESYEVSLDASVRSYTLDSNILQVLGARVDGETSPLQAGFTPLGGAFFNGSEGMPTRYSMIGGAHKISFYPTPDDTYTVKLVAAVRPSVDIAATTSPEVPAQFHPALADYAASKCLLQNDVDGLNVASAQALGASFLEACRDLKRLVYQYRLGPDANVVPMRIT
jgi:hypothetical protein